jgi:acyl dehydratase
VTPSADAALSPEAIARARRLVGTEIQVWPWNTAAGQDAIRHFAFAVGDDNPLWWDREYAEGSAVGGVTAPPTFLYTLMTGGPWPSGNGGGRADVLPGAVGLWAEDRWTWYSRVAVGQRLTARATLWSLEEKRRRTGEPMVAQTEHYEIAADPGGRIGELYRTVMRLEPRARRPASAPPSALHHYTAQDMAVIERQYAAEAGQRRGGQPRFWDDVAVGDSIGRIVKGPLTIGGIAAFMAGLGPPMLPVNRIANSYVRHSSWLGLRHANGTVDPMGAIHLDGELAGRAGFDRGYDLGSQRISWLAHAVSDWMGDAGQLLHLQVRILRSNLVGDVTWITGRVCGKNTDARGSSVECVLTATNQRDQETTSGTATVLLPRRSAAPADEEPERNA